MQGYSALCPCEFESVPSSMPGIVRMCLSNRVMANTLRHRDPSTCSLQAKVSASSVHIFEVYKVPSICRHEMSVVSICWFFFLRPAYILRYWFAFCTYSEARWVRHPNNLYFLHFLNYFKNLYHKIYKKCLK